MKQGKEKKTENLFAGALDFHINRFGSGTARIIEYNGRKIIFLENKEALYSDCSSKTIEELCNIIEIPNELRVLSASECFENGITKAAKNKEINLIKIRIEHCADGSKPNYEQQIEGLRATKPLKIEEITDDDLMKLVNNKRLIAFVQKYGIPREKGYSYYERLTDTEKIEIVPYDEALNCSSTFCPSVGYDYIHLCGRILMYCAFVEVIAQTKRFSISHEKTMCAFAFFDGIRIRIAAGHPLDSGGALERISWAYAKNSRGESSRVQSVNVFVKQAFETDIRGLGFTFSWKNYRPIAYSRDYFSFFAYTLLIRWNLILDGKTMKGTPKMCAHDRCNNIFWAENAQRIYCDSCDRRKVHSQKVTEAKLLKEKEGAQNG